MASKDFSPIVLEWLKFCETKHTSPGYSLRRKSSSSTPSSSGSGSFSLREEPTENAMGPTFRKYWAREVPKIYSTRPNCDCLNIVYDEQAAKIALFDPLEQFITNSTNPIAVYERLKQSDDPPQLCGRVFKSGEPTYSCRDCGLDPTCVLCVDCFTNRCVQ